LGIAQKIDYSAFRIAKEDAMTVSKQVQTGSARSQIGETMTELAA
jgi:cytochrome c-type biogenesis protein CcmH/NrfF